MSGYRPRVLSKEMLGVYFGRANTPRIRSVYANTAAVEGDRSFSDFVEKAVMKEVRDREGKHNGGRSWPEVPAGALPVGRPKRRRPPTDAEDGAVGG
jgi:hypothetical protein